MNNQNSNEITDKDASILIEDIIARNQHGKNEMCKSDPMTDNPALFLCVWESDSDDENHEGAVDYQQSLGFSLAYQVGMIPLLHKQDSYESLLDVIKAMPIQKFTYIFVSAEGYMDSAEKGQGLVDDPDYKRGGLEQDFKNNINTTVKEALVFCGTNWKGDTLYSASCTYTYDDAGVPVWDKAIVCEKTITNEDIMGEESFGRFADALLTTTIYMQKSVLAQDFHSLMLKKPKSTDETKKR